MTPIIIGAIVLLHLLAIVDLYTSRLNRPTRILWTVLLIGIPGVGFMAWMITRHTAHQAEAVPAE